MHTHSQIHTHTLHIAPGCHHRFLFDELNPLVSMVIFALMQSYKTKYLLMVIDSRLTTMYYCTVL